MTPFQHCHAAHVAALLTPEHRRWADPMDVAILEVRAWMLALRDTHGTNYRPAPRDVWRAFSKAMGATVVMDAHLRDRLPPDLRALLFR